MTLPPVTLKSAPHIIVDEAPHKPRRFDQFFTNSSSPNQKQHFCFTKAVIWVAHRIVDLIRAIALKILWGLQSFGIHKKATLIESANFYHETAKMQHDVAYLKTKTLEDLQDLHPSPFLIDLPRQETLIDGQRFEDSSSIGKKIFHLIRPKTTLSDHDLHILRYLLENLLYQASFMVVPGFFEELFTIHTPLQSADLASWTKNGVEEPEGQKMLREAKKPSSRYELKIIDDNVIVSGLRYFRIFEMSDPNSIRGYDACTFEIAIKISDITAIDFLLTPGAVMCKTQSYGIRSAIQHILW